MRACAACRARLPSAELVRFVLEGERVVVDLERRRGGRGVNLGPTRLCFDRALKRGAFQRGFRRPIQRSELEALPARAGAAFGDALARACRGGLRSGAALAVDSLSQVLPVDLRRLIEAAAGTELAKKIPLVAVMGGPLEARIAWLLGGVSEFTFDMAGGIGPRLRGQVPCSAAKTPRSPSEKA